MKSVSKVALCLALAVPCVALADAEEFTLVLKEHRFSPAELRVPAGKKIKLFVDNQDATAEEFESHELNREKIIPGNAKGHVYIGPLEPGRYPYFGDFNAQAARGVIIAE